MMRHGGFGGGHGMRGGFGRPGMHHGMRPGMGHYGRPFRPAPLYRPFWGGRMMMGWGGFLWAPFVTVGFMLLVFSNILASSLPSLIGLVLVVAGLVVLFGRQADEDEEKTKRKNNAFDEYEGYGG